MADEWITISEAVQRSGYSGEHIRRKIRSGQIKAQKFGIVWQISRKSLEHYSATQKERGAKTGPKKVA